MLRQITRRFFLLLILGCYQLNIIDDHHTQLHDIHCISEELDVMRNGGIEDITRIVIDRSKVITDNVNVIVKGNVTHRRKHRHN